MTDESLLKPLMNLCGNDMFSRGNFADINFNVTEKRAPTDESDDLLKVRYKNGEVFDSPDFATIRARAQSCLN